MCKKACSMSLGKIVHTGHHTPEDNFKSLHGHAFFYLIRVMLCPLDLGGPFNFKRHKQVCQMRSSKLSLGREGKVRIIFRSKRAYLLVLHAWHKTLCSTPPAHSPKLNAPGSKPSDQSAKRKTLFPRSTRPPILFRRSVPMIPVM